MLDTGSQGELISPKSNMTDSVTSQDVTSEATYVGTSVVNPAEEEDYDTDLEEEKLPKVRPVPNRDRPRVVYLKACRRLNITPSSTFLKGLKENVINLNHQTLGPKGSMAVALGLVMSNNVTELRMSGNVVGDVGINYITRMLKEDDTVTYVDLSENDLQSYGAKLVTEMTIDNDTISTLVLAGNRFRAEDAEHFHLMISHYRCVLRVLDLSHNDFGEEGGKLLGEAIGNNDTLEVLNISWNRLGVRGAKAVAKGLQENTSLRHLDVSWNGIQDEGGKVIAEALSVADTLRSLNLNSNRIGHLGLADVMKAIGACKQLRKLDISGNPISFEGPVIAITIVLKYPECGLQELSCVDMCVSDKFIPILKQIHSHKPRFTVNHGGYVNGSDLIEHAKRQRDENILNDAMMKLLEYIHEKKLRWADLFFQLDADKSMSISEKEFIDGLKRAEIPLSDQQIRQLVERLDTDQDGEVDFGELIEGQKRYMNRLQRIKDNYAIDPNLLKTPDRSTTTKQRPPPSKSRPTSSSQQSRPTSSSQKSRPTSSTELPRPPSSRAKSRPSSSSKQNSRPPSRSGRRDHSEAIQTDFTEEVRES